RSVYSRWHVAWSSLKKPLCSVRIKVSLKSRFIPCACIGTGGIKKKTAILDAIAAQAAVPMKYEKKSAYRGVVDNTAVLALLCDLGVSFASAIPCVCLASQVFQVELLQ
ncbi:hypothetical protein L917_11590, partial [Phytophthora nicotianae]